MKTSLALSILLALAACSGSPKTVTVAQGGGSSDGTAAGSSDGSGAGSSDGSAASLPGRGQACADGACAEGLDCLTYYGIAGPAGPAFTSCETSCAKSPKACPAGTTCMTIADGPGQVCR